MFASGLRSLWRCSASLRVAWPIRTEDLGGFSAPARERKDSLVGTISRDEFDAQVDVLKEERGQAMQIAVDTAKRNSKEAAEVAVEDIKDSVARTQETAAKAAKIGGSILFPGTSGIWDVLIGVGGGMLGLNTYRSRTRRKALSEVTSEPS